MLSTTTGDFTCIIEGPAAVKDVAFGICRDIEKQELIHKGFLIPFGSSSEIAASANTNKTRTTLSANRPTHLDFDWLGVSSFSEPILHSPSSSSTASSVTIPPPTTSSGKGKASLRKHKTASKKATQYGNKDVTRLGNEEDDHLYVLQEEDEESSYYTDEELGGAFNSYKTKQHNKNFKMRKLSSDEEEDKLAWGRGDVRRRKRWSNGRVLDDGDDDMYKIRIELAVDQPLYSSGISPAPLTDELSLRMKCLVYCFRVGFKCRLKYGTSCTGKIS